MIILTVLVTIVVAAALRGALIMLLWNWLLPSILSAPEINMLEGIGLYILAALLFSNVVDSNMLPTKKEKKEIKE